MKQIIINRCSKCDFNASVTLLDENTPKEKLDLLLNHNIKVSFHKLDHRLEEIKKERHSNKLSFGLNEAGKFFLGLTK